MKKLLLIGCLFYSVKVIASNLTCPPTEYVTCTIDRGIGTCSYEQQGVGKWTGYVTCMGGGNQDPFCDYPSATLEFVTGVHDGRGEPNRIFNGNADNSPIGCNYEGIGREGEIVTLRLNSPKGVTMQGVTYNEWHHVLPDAMSCSTLASNKCSFKKYHN